MREQRTSIPTGRRSQLNGAGDARSVFFDRSTALQVEQSLRPPDRIDASPHASLQLSLNPPALSIA